MSAYQVNRDTIDLMVSSLIEWGGPGNRSPYLYTWGALPNDPQLLELVEDRGEYQITRIGYTEADALGRELIDANVASLAGRYSDGVDMCEYFAEGYTWRGVDPDLVSVPRAMGAVNCYRYQACEHATWRGSYADELSQRVMDHLVSIISEGWDYERPANAPVRVSLANIARNNKAGK